MEILWLKSRNEPHQRIAELADVSRSTVQRTLRIYLAKGLDGIRSFGWKGQPSALTPLLPDAWATQHLPASH